MISYAHVFLAKMFDQAKRSVVKQEDVARFALHANVTSRFGMNIFKTRHLFWCVFSNGQGHVAQKEWVLLTLWHWRAKNCHYMNITNSQV